MESINYRLGLRCPSSGVLLFVFTLLVAGLSFSNATRHMTHSVWYDESQTAAVAQKGTLAEVTVQAMHQRPYPPLFFYAVHESLRFRNDETGLRMPAALFGALAIVAVFWLGKTLVDSVTGALAAFLFAFTPGMFRFMVDGNAYTLLALLSALSTLYVFKGGTIQPQCGLDGLYVLCTARPCYAHAFCLSRWRSVLRIHVP